MIPGVVKDSLDHRCHYHLVFHDENAHTAMFWNGPHRISVML